MNGWDLGHCFGLWRQPTIRESGCMFIVMVLCLINSGIVMAAGIAGEKDAYDSSESLAKDHFDKLVREFKSRPSEFIDGEEWKQ